MKKNKEFDNSSSGDENDEDDQDESKSEGSGGYEENVELKSSEQTFES